MGKCVYCGNGSNNKENATLRRFPQDEKLRQEWVKLVGRENVVLRKYSELCSAHFTENSFIYYNNGRVKKRIKPGSIPMISLKKDNLKDVPHPVNEIENVSHVCNEVESTEVMEYNGVCVKQSTLTTNSGTMNRIGNTAYEKVIHDHHYMNSPRSTNKVLQRIRKKQKFLQRENKNLRRKCNRLKRKVHSLVEVMHELKKQKFLPDSAYYALSGHEDVCMELFNCMLKNRKKRDKLTREKYPPALRTFALTIHFYSPKVYIYIRKTFDLALLHPDVLRTWYRCIDAEPGFTEECFTTLKQMAGELDKEGKKVICALMMDEMGTKKGCQRGRDGKMRGHVDLGVGHTGGDDLLEAKNALVLMVVIIDRHCKLPIGYFLIDTLSAETKANLIQEALIRLQKAGVTITSLTLDGPADHFSTVEKLGARMHIPRNETKGKNNMVPKEQALIRIARIFFLIYLK